MPDTTKPIEVSENTGIVDLLTAAGRYLVVIIGAVPLLMQLLGNRDFAGLVAYFQGADGKALIAAAVALGTLAYGLWKTRKRGVQVVQIAADPRTPNSVASVR